MLLDLGHGDLVSYGECVDGMFCSVVSFAA